MVVIVSEETGSISVAIGGMLKRHLKPETLENILRKGDDIKLIDFEYACFCSPYWDYASFITETRLSGPLLDSFIEASGADRTRLLKAMIIVDYIWGLWGFYRECIDYGRGRIAEMDRNLRLLQAGGTL